MVTLKRSTIVLFVQLRLQWCYVCGSRGDGVRMQCSICPTYQRHYALVLLSCCEGCWIGNKKLFGHAVPPMCDRLR